MTDHMIPKTVTKEEIMHSTSKKEDMINAVKYRLRMVVYYPFQIIIALVYAPVFLIEFAVMNTESLAFEYTYMTADNPRVNQEGPTRMRMKKHCWLVRFLCPWL